MNELAEMRAISVEDAYAERRWKVPAGRLGDPADADPLPAEQLVDLERQELRRGVEAGRHAPGLPVRSAEAGPKCGAHAFR